MRTGFIALVTGLALLALGVPSAPGQTQATVTVTPSTGLQDGDIVTVSGSGFPVATTSIGVAQCEAAVTTLPGNCVGQLVTGASNGSFSTTFTVQRFIGNLDCAAAPGTCVIGASNLNGGPAFSHQATAPLTFASSQACAGLQSTVVGTPGDDVLGGTSGDDVIQGLGGNDTISGSAGADVICGGDGNDTISGGSGDDTLFGDAGVDALDGDSGNDQLNGGDDGDTLRGGSGNDVISGEAGNDVLEGESGNDALDGGPATDRCDGGTGTNATTNCEGIVPPGPTACVDGDGNGNPDNDGDALCDNWETIGLDGDNDGVADLQLYDIDGSGAVDPGEQSDLDHKDIYLEIDFMALHQPSQAAVDDVIAAFAAAPVVNPDGSSGISLHVLVDEEAAAHNDELALVGCTAPAPAGVPDFDLVKAASFGTAGERGIGMSVTNAKRFAFHYSLYVHNLLGLGSTSGCAEIFGNDFIVSLGGWTTPTGATHPVGSRDEQAGTLMHEFGHNLNLRHGGANDDNCKPNYLSVMSYTRQIDGSPIPGRRLDYSPAALPTLDEGSLDEPAGIGGPAGDQTAYGPPPRIVAPADGPKDWNRDGDTVDAGVSADINNMGTGTGCSGSGTVLTGFDDWANLRYDFQNSGDFADGVHLSVIREITFEQAEALREVPIG